MDCSVSFDSLKITAHAIGNCRNLVSSLKERSTSDIAEIIAKSFLKNKFGTMRGLYESIVEIDGAEYKILYRVSNIHHILTVGKKGYYYLD